MVNSTIQPVEVTVTDRINLDDIPLSALKGPTHKMLSALLNKKKIFTSPNGYCRDWRGLFQAVNLEKHYVSELENHANPTQRVLDLWEDSGKRSHMKPNLRALQDVLGSIDRWDVLDDSDKLFYEDAESYLADKQRAANRVTDPLEVQQQLDECKGVDEDIITKDDTRSNKQIYDAFVLFADADIEFATKIIDRMEQRKLKLCVKDRDILPGISFEHDAIIRLISERCRRLLVVMSKEFQKSPLNEFFVTYAQALQIEQKKRKIIPCVYERFQLPAAMRFYFILDYKRSNNLYNFWDKMEDALKIRAEPPLNEARHQIQPAESMLVPTIQISDVEEQSITDVVPTAPENDERPVVENTASGMHTPLQPIKKSLSSWDISLAFNRVLTNKSKAASSSTSELTSNCETRENELKKRKWYSKLRLSSSKTTLDGPGETSEKKKQKWYKPNKKIATAL